jgi:NADH-quinone oxidoreductase subunit H
MHDEVLQLVQMFGKPAWVGLDFVYLGFMVGCVAVLIGFVSGFAGISTYVERKIAAHMQARLGPMRVGPHGILQFLADGAKLILKEDIIPTNADGLLFRLAPYIVFMASFGAFAIVPFAPAVGATDMNVGIFFILAVTSGGVIGLLMAGWSSGNKWSLLGAMRSAAQIVSYEIPVGMSLLTVLLIAGTLNLTEIVDQQKWGICSLGGVFGWYVFRYPIFTIPAFLIYYTGVLAETNRTPFDIPEAESELVSGYHTEYSGMRFSFFFLSEYGSMLLVSLIGAIVFLGGWHPAYPLVPGVLEQPLLWYLLGDIGIVLEGILWMLLKGVALVIVMMWLRWTLPRYRVDQLMDLCWKKLIPLSFINIFGVAVVHTFVRQFDVLRWFFGV